MSVAHRIDLRVDTRPGGSVAYLTIDNRAKLNTLDRALMSEFIATVEALAPRTSSRWCTAPATACAACRCR